MSLAFCIYYIGVFFFFLKIRAICQYLFKISNNFIELVKVSCEFQFSLLSLFSIFNYLAFFFFKFIAASWSASSVSTPFLSSWHPQWSPALEGRLTLSSPRAPQQTAFPLPSPLPLRPPGWLMLCVSLGRSGSLQCCAVRTLDMAAIRYAVLMFPHSV